MTKSRMAAPLFLFAAPAAAHAAPGSAAEAIGKYERMVAPAKGAAGCPDAAEEDAVVVCGRRPATQRVGPTDEPGARVRGTPGGLDALTSADRCVSRCPQPVDLLKGADFVARAISRLLDPDN